METPACLLRRNLYGHKLAGVLWQKHAEDIIINKLEIDKLLSWECLYVHREEQLYLSVYFDDLKMAGKKESAKPMWEEAKVFTDLEDPKNMVDNKCLGCAQKEIIPAEENVERMGAAFENPAVKRGDPSARVAHPDLRKGDIDDSERDVNVFAEKESMSIELGNNYSRYR